MLGDLQKLDAEGLDGLRLLVISTGTAEENRKMNLRSSILIDPGQARAPFGANGTPMAVLLDSAGRIASGVAAGSRAIFALANGLR